MFTFITTPHRPRFDVLQRLSIPDKGQWQVVSICATETDYRYELHSPEGRWIITEDELIELVYPPQLELFTTEVHHGNVQGLSG